MTPMRLALGFIAGFLSVPIFQQAVAALLHAAGVFPSPAWPLEPTGPFGVPKTLDYAFWGGVWGIVYALVEPRLVPRLGVWLAGLLFGAIGPVIVLLFIVLHLKGGPVGGGLPLPALLVLILLHAVFGLGTALIFRLGQRLTRSERPAAL
jgi:hypothetical protein